MGNPVTLIARVSDIWAPAVTPTGTVRFERDGAPLGAGVALEATGTARLTIGPLAMGGHSMHAYYDPGDPRFVASEGTTGVFDVLRREVRVSVTAAPDPSVAGQDVELTATVTAVAAGFDAPTGSVQFTEDDGSPIGDPEPVGADGRASLIAAAGAGSYRLHARYSGDATYTTGEAIVAQTVTRAATKTTLASTPNPVPTGGTLLLDVTVDVLAPGAVDPDGSLEFTVDGAPIGDPLYLGGYSGVEVELTAPTIPGTATIGVRYNGGPNTQPSSAALMQTVVAPPATQPPRPAPPAAPTTPAAPTAPTSSARTALASLAAAVRSQVRRRGLRALVLSFRAPAAGRVEITLSARRTVLARGARGVAGPGVATVRLRLTAAGRRAARRTPPMALTLRSRFTPRTGPAITRRDKFTARPRPSATALRVVAMKPAPAAPRHPLRR